MKILRVPISQKSQLGISTQLIALQQCFSGACQLVAQIALQSGCFSRVQLHHLAYKTVRERFPGLGSQLVSNAIYAVCREARGLESPVLENLRFTEHSPVFFDRHTLSVKQGTLSMFTLDGRMKFQVSLSPQFLRLFKEGRLKEVQLIREDDQFFLLFFFKQAASDQAVPEEIEQVA